MSSIVNTIRATLSALRAKATADLPPHKIGEGEVDPALQPLEKELTIALDQLKAFKNDDKAKHLHAKDLREAREILGHGDSLYHEGVFHVEGVASDAIPPGQAKLASMLAEGHELLRECLDRVDAYHVADPLRGLSTKLDNVIHALEGLKEKTDLHPGDLLHLRRKLAEIDAHYHEGRFDKAGADEKVPEGQAVLAQNLATAHETVRALLMKTDYYKVDKGLFPIHDRLENLKMRLEGLLGKGNVTERDLVSLRDRLQRCDEEWKEGKIEIEGRVPEGQAAVSKLLFETHNLMSQVQNRMK